MIQLQGRDRLILNYLKRVGWSLPSYISYHYFDNNNRATANRLKKLEQINLIQSTTIKDLRFTLLNKETIFTLFSGLSLRTKIYRLHDSVIDLVSNDLSYNTDKRLLIHQLMLSFTFKSYSSLLNIKDYLTEEEKKKFFKINNFYSSYDDSEPDLIIDLGSSKIAIEIERKARRGLGKYNSAYNDRIDKLLNQNNYVIYIMENINDLKSMVNNSEGLRRVGFCSIYDLNVILRKGYDKTGLVNFIKVD